LNPQDLIILFGFALISLLFFTYRLHLLLKSHELNKSYFQTWRLSMIGLFFNYTLPGGTGGDLFKIYYLVRANTEKRGLAVGLVVLDRLLGLYGMVGMAMISFVLRPTAIAGDNELFWLFLFTLAVFSCL